MTTSHQPTPLTVDELDGLRRCAQDPATVDPALREALLAKGMLQSETDGLMLTPAGQHALHVDTGPTVPGIDN